jgi:trans-aconitate 2-methyltransferase
MTEWNSRAYARLSNPMQTWGEAIVAELPLRGDETALDLGCGDGRLTYFLLQRLPRGHVIAVDRSANMLEAAQNRLSHEFDGRVSYVQRSLEQIEYRSEMDLAFSNAAFHWIKDHPKLFAAIFTALKPGGWLVAQCGGGANIARVRERLAKLMSSEPYKNFFGDWTGPWEFASPELTAERLKAAGFVDIETSTFEAPVQLSSREETYDYFEHVILGSHLERIPDAKLKANFVESMTEQSARDTPPYCQDYWRLNLRARRPTT